MSLKQLGASTARPSGIRTLLPVVRTGDGKKESTATSPVPVSDSPNEGETAAGASKSSKRKRPAAPPPPPPPMEVPPELPAVELPPPPPPPSIEQQRRSGFIVEGGEVSLQNYHTCNYKQVVP